MEHRPYPPNATSRPRSRFPWPLIALCVAVVLLVITLWLTPRSNQASTGTAGASGLSAAQLHISAVSLAPQEAHHQANVDVYGQVTNTGGQPVTGAIISATFKDKDGNPIVTQQQPMQRVELKSRDKELKPEDLAQDPIKSGQTAGFRVSYTQIPGTWNQQPPDLSVLQVTVPK
ncbi:MAG TPA: hypothetical protein VLT16_05415 [Candidatus Limnocylindrales bacterium]|nr:hypothetical protein [Candidatus Limnocylindrales bacterium]